MSSPEQMHNRITNADDNKSPPVFCQTPCCKHVPSTLCSSIRSVVHPKTVTKNGNCFEFALTNLKTVSNPKVKSKT